MNSNTNEPLAPVAVVAKKQSKSRAKTSAKAKLVVTKDDENFIDEFEKKIETELPAVEEEQPVTTMDAEPATTTNAEFVAEELVESETDDLDEEEREALRLVEEIRKKKAKREASAKLPMLREKRVSEIDCEEKKLRERIEAIEYEILALKTERDATMNGENDDLLIALELQKRPVITTRAKPVASFASGEKREVKKILRPELNEICSKKTTFKCVWAKGVEYIATYDPAERILTYNGNEYKNLNDWVNGKEKVAGNSIADERGQKSSAKSAWKVCWVKNADDEWVWCDTLVKGCEFVI